MCVSFASSLVLPFLFLPPFPISAVLIFSLPPFLFASARSCEIQCIASGDATRLRRCTARSRARLL